MECPDREEFSACRTASAATGAHGQDRFFMPAVERPRALWGGSIGGIARPISGRWRLLRRRTAER